MSERDLPTIDELAIGAFLHDIGKLYQRALGTVRSLPDVVRDLDTTLLPPDGHGGYGYKHVLFTELLFHELEMEGLELPRAVRLGRVRDAAVWHHKPDSGPAWASVVAVADRLSAGMDRKQADALTEREGDPKGWDAFRKKPLSWILDTVDLGLGRPPAEHALPPGPLEAPALFPAPRATIDGPTVIQAYGHCRDGFRAGLAALLDTHRDAPALFMEGLFGLSERWLWAVPSSTVSEADVSLHDHAHSVAAFAACLWAHHAEHGELDDRVAIRDGTRPKFRLLTGDLSGIQSTLFRLAAQQVQGANRILRGRSFLIGALLEAAALLVRQTFGLPPFVVLQRAGGRFLILLPELEGIEERIQALQARIDAWLARTYAGDLSLRLALTVPLPGEAFAKARLAATFELVRQATESGKQTALASVLESTGPVLAADYEAGADGACRACGVRPAKHDGRCIACDAEHDYGQQLPHAKAVLWLPGAADVTEASFCPFDAFRLLVTRDPRPGRNVLSAWRMRGREAAWPAAARFVANHVPRLHPELVGDRRLQGLSAEAQAVEPGDMLLFEQLGALAKDKDTEVGRPMLAVLKADVDRLGLVFAMGLGKDRTVGRIVALSRLVDAFFTGWLTERLQRDFPDTYTVYAGGDDLLLIGPWHRTIDLAAALRADFERFAGDNPNLTLSAGIELVDVREPISRAAARADMRLDAAKDAGRDRIGLIDGPPMPWAGLAGLLGRAAWLDGLIRAQKVSTVWLYKLLHFADEKQRAETGDTRAAIWRARYAYHLARAFPKDEAIWLKFHELMGETGKSVPTRAVLSIALWRNR